MSRNTRLYAAIAEAIHTYARDDIDAYYIWTVLTDLLLNMYKCAEHNQQLQSELRQSLEYLLKTIKNELRFNLN